MSSEHKSPGAVRDEVLAPYEAMRACGHAGAGLELDGDTVVCGRCRAPLKTSGGMAADRRNGSEGLPVSVSTPPASGPEEAGFSSRVLAERVFSVAFDECARVHGPNLARVREPAWQAFAAIFADMHDSLAITAAKQARYVILRFALAAAQSKPVEADEARS